MWLKFVAIYIFKPIAIATAVGIVIAIKFYKVANFVYIH